MKKVILIFLFLAMLASVVYSATVVTLDSTGVLANNSYKTSSTIDYNFKVVGNQSVYNCYLYSNENSSYGTGNWRQIETKSSVANNSNTSFTSRNDILEINGLNYRWNVVCNHTDNLGTDWGVDSNYTTYSEGTYRYGVDVTDPTVSINYPAYNGAWYNNRAGARIGLTVIDNNANKCVLFTSLNASSNNTKTLNTSIVDELYSYTNNTQFNFTKINITNGYNDNNTGAYLWTYTCNDTAGHSVSLGSNYKFYIDTTAPSTFDFNTSLFKTTNNIFIPNNSYATDYTPQVGWGITTELNFSAYEIRFENSTGDAVSKNITSKTTLSTSIGSLLADTVYRIMIIAYDMAGNTRNITTRGYSYTTDSTSRNLYSGWNIIMNTGNAMNLSNFLDFSDATQVSYFNASHQFETYVDGGSYGSRSIPYGESVFIYKAANGVMEDLVLNTTSQPLKYNIINTTSSDWNVACERNTTHSHTFQKLDIWFNGLRTSYLPQNVTSFNVTYLDFYNNSASSGAKFIPFVANWSINNGTTLNYGDCAWMFLGQDHPNTFFEIDWTNI